MMFFFSTEVMRATVDPAPKRANCSVLVIRYPHGHGVPRYVNLYEAIPKSYASPAGEVLDASPNNVAVWFNHFSQCLDAASLFSIEIRALSEQDRIPISSEILKHEKVVAMATRIAEARDIANLLLKIGAQIGADVKGIEDFLLEPIQFEAKRKSAIDCANRIKVRYAASAPPPGAATKTVIDGEKSAPKEGVAIPPPTAEAASVPVKRENTFAGIGEIQRIFRIPKAKYSALDGRLKRFRRKNMGNSKAFVESDSPSKNESRYLFNLAMISPLIQDLSGAPSDAPNGAPDKRPTKDFLR
jgi:hypothetical protein